MKWTKLSLVAALAVSSAVAGGDVVAPVVAAASQPATTIDGKLVGYYYSDNNAWGDLDSSLFDNDTSSLATAVTLNVSHKFTENITGNVTALGYAQVSTPDGMINGVAYNPFYLGSEKSGAYLNVANITATYGDNTFILGRQLIDSPMVKGYDWLLAPGSFEAFTAVNNSIDKVTLVGTYITKFRSCYGGDEFADLEGENWAVSAAYSDAFNASVWYYNIDNGDTPYTQVYVDASKELSGITGSVQYVSTDYDAATNSDAYGIKVATKLGEVDVDAAYVNVNDAAAGFIDYDGLYTSMWMAVASAYVGDSYKVGASTELNGLSTSVAYASYADGDVDEYDVILGYGVTDSISVDAIYSSLDDSDLADERINTFELIATYKF